MSSNEHERNEHDSVYSVIMLANDALNKATSAAEKAGQALELSNKIVSLQETIQKTLADHMREEEKVYQQQLAENKERDKVLKDIAVSLSDLSHEIKGANRDAEGKVAECKSKLKEDFKKDIDGIGTKVSACETKIALLEQFVAAHKESHARKDANHAKWNYGLSFLFLSLLAASIWNMLTGVPKS